MVYNSMEMDYLLSLLKAVLNNEAAGDTGPRHDWSLLFNISSYHRVQTMICYALLFNESMPPEWRERYGARFRELVTKDAAYRKMVHGILEMLEKDDIPSVLLPPQEVKGLYPQSDMREVDGLSLLIREDRVGRLFQTMYAGGFRYEGKVCRGDTGSLRLMAGILPRMSACSSATERWSVCLPIYGNESIGLRGRMSYIVWSRRTGIC